VAMFLALTLIFVAIGWALGTYLIGTPILGMAIFLALAVVMNAVSYFLSDRIVLFSYRARMVEESEAPRLYGIVRKVAQEGGIPMPRVAIIPTETPNAFATGRNPKHAVVAATEGIMRILDDEELEGVIAHEVSHVRNRDILVMSVAATLAGAIAIAARYAIFSSMFGGRRNQSGGVMLILAAITAPIAAMLIQLAVSRSREYGADASGASISGKPLALASALEKLEYANTRRPLQFGNPASSGLFIVNPFTKSALVSLFSTHPPIEERIARLRAM